MDSENSQLINPDGPSQANIDQDMYMGEPQAQFFGRDNGPIIANRGPDLSSFTNTMFSDNQERVQGARNNTNSWENGGPHGNNENPEAVLIASALASAIFPSQPQFGEVHVLAYGVAELTTSSIQMSRLAFQALWTLESSVCQFLTLI